MADSVTYIATNFLTKLNDLKYSLYVMAVNFSIKNPAIWRHTTGN